MSTTLTRLQRADSDQRAKLSLSKSPDREAECSSSDRSMSLGWCPLQRLSFLVVRQDPHECLVEGMPAKWFGGRQHAVHILRFADSMRRKRIPKQSYCKLSQTSLKNICLSDRIELIRVGLGATTLTAIANQASFWILTDSATCCHFTRARSVQKDRAQECGQSAQGTADSPPGGLRIRSIMPHTSIR
jgi:hypothetical protein